MSEVIEKKEESAPQQIAPIQTGLSIFDSGQFEQFYRVAEALAQSSLIPETLKGIKKGQSFAPYPPEQVTANCLRVVEQSYRWGFSPFAVVDCASVIHGKLMWEGKLVAAALEANLGVRLNYEYEGEGEKLKVTVSGTLTGEREPRTVEGWVAIWKTDQWQRNAYHQRLAYRGAREWARRHAPSVMLGVVTQDEAQDFDKMKNVTPLAREHIINPFAQSAGDSYGQTNEQHGEQSKTYTEEKESKEHNLLSSKTVPQPSPEESAHSNAHEQTAEAGAGSPLRPAFVVSVEVKRGDKEDGGKWTGYFVKLSNGEKTIISTTFSTRIGKLAQSAVNTDVMVELEKTDRGYSLKDIKPSGREEDMLI